MRHNRPILNLTPKQLQRLKGVLDSQLIAIGLTGLFVRGIDDDASKRTIEQWDTYQKVIDALSTLGVVVEGHTWLSDAYQGNRQYRDQGSQETGPA